MSSENPFKGKIKLVDLNSGKVQKIVLSFDETPKSSVPMDQTFMRKFNMLKLTKEEKINLSTIDRQIIYYYRSIDCSKLEFLAKKFMEKISKLQERKISIRAENFGAYICLTSLFSGNLPQNKIIHFELSNVPLSLFPKKLLPVSGIENVEVGSHSVVFDYERDSWIAPFKSLHNCPQIDGFNHSFKTQITFGRAA